MLEVRAGDTSLLVHMALLQCHQKQLVWRSCHGCQNFPPANISKRVKKKIYHDALTLVENVKTKPQPLHTFFIWFRQKKRKLVGSCCRRRRCFRSHCHRCCLCITVNVVVVVIVDVLVILFVGFVVDVILFIVVVVVVDVVVDVVSVVMCE